MSACPACGNPLTKEADAPTKRFQCAYCSGLWFPSATDAAPAYAVAASVDAAPSKTARVFCPACSDATLRLIPHSSPSAYSCNRCHGVFVQSDHLPTDSGPAVASHPLLIAIPSAVVLLGLMYWSLHYPWPTGPFDLFGFVAFWFRELATLVLFILALILVAYRTLKKRLLSRPSGSSNAP